MTKIEKMKEKFDNKIEQEYKEWLEALKQCTPEVIIEKCYEKVTKEEMIYNLKGREYTIEELKALLKAHGILAECYDEWLKSDGNFNELLEYAVETRVDSIIEEFKEQNQKGRER